MTLKMTSNVTINGDVPVHREGEGEKKLSGSNSENMRQGATGNSTDQPDLEMALIPDNHQLRMELEDLRKQIYEIRMGGNSGVEKPKAKKKGNPAVVGLAGFGLTTMVLQFHNIESMEGITPIISLGLIFGGLAQFIAGLQEYQTGNNFGYSAFCTYGSFWIALSIIFLLREIPEFKADPLDIGYFLIAFTLYTGLMCGAAAGISLALFIVFFTLLLGFICLDISHFQHTPDEVHTAQVVGGWILLICSFSAWYVMAHVVYEDTYGNNLLPVGPAPITILKNLYRRRR